MRFAAQSSREVARFLDAISFDDTSQSFSGLSGDGAHRELGAAMGHVLDLLRTGRAEREAQSRYLQTLIAHVPVALISVDEIGRVQLLNMAARRLFETALTQVCATTYNMPATGGLRSGHGLAASGHQRDTQNGARLRRPAAEGRGH